MPPTVQDHQKELEEYKTSTSTVQFPLTQDLPVGLIKRLILYGVERNEKKEKSQ
jgi:uncharacterized protein YdhG (YjbR/CyaY superfamily)